MPLQQTSGNLTTDAFGGGAASVPNYIEDVFSTWLYTGNTSTQAISNGINLAGKGGLVWIKDRTSAYNNVLVDSARGKTSTYYDILFSNLTNASNTAPSYGVSSFDASGFTLSGPIQTLTNASPDNYASWTFRKQPKFFDIVTYTGDGNSSQAISHNLGSVPGCIISKCTSDVANWRVYHVSTGATNVQFLNTTAATAADVNAWNNTAPTSTQFTVGADSNGSGRTYVAYLFAHNAGGFGLTGTDNVISCGSYTVGATPPATITLGYEPQFVMVKAVSGSFPTGPWYMVDSMRGFVNNDGTQNSTLLQANSSAVESANALGVWPTATGFQASIAPSTTFIYIAIRRGPMKVPTDATTIFSPNATASQPVTIATPTAPDMALTRILGSANSNWNSAVASRLTGDGYNLITSSTGAEITNNQGSFYFTSGQSFIGNISAASMAYYVFKRAPGFFDEVCYTGTGAATTVTHNLAAVPELMIVKSRSNGTAGYEWAVYSSGLTSAAYYLLLNTTAAQNSGTAQWNSTVPTSSVFSVGTSSRTNGSGITYVAYLFASCPGVSKVGTYTGNGTTQTINCGFAGGARFVLIKRTDSTGDWYVYDTARGMTTLTDPYLLLNTTAAESATLGSVTTVTTGFAVNASILAAINTNGASYIYLSIA